MQEWSKDAKKCQKWVGKWVFSTPHWAKMDKNRHFPGKNGPKWATTGIVKANMGQNTQKQAFSR